MTSELSALRLCAAPGRVRAPAWALLLSVLLTAAAWAQGLPGRAAGTEPGGYAAAARAQEAPLSEPEATDELDPQKAGTPLAEIKGFTPGPREARPGLEDQPEVRAHYEAAVELMAEEEYRRVVAELDAALNLARGDCYDLLYLMAQAKYRLGRYGEARMAAEHAAAYRPQAADVHYLLGRQYREQGRLDAAIACFRTATLAEEHEPENPRVTAAWHELGECLAERGYLWAAAEAFERFDRAVWDVRPQHRQAEEIVAILAQQPYGAIERRLELLKRLGKPEQYARALAGALESRPDEPYLERLYVRTLLEVGQAAEAFEFCRQRLEAAEAQSASQPATGEARRAALLTSAIEAAQAADRLGGWVAQLEADVAQGRQVALAARLARRLDQAGEHALSAGLWRTLADAEPESVDTAWALASALKESGDLAAALDSLIEFVRRSPHRAEIPPERLAAWMRSFQVTDEFLRLVADLSARDDCDFATYTVLGTTAAAAGQTELAERLFGAGLEERADSPLAHVAWGRMLLTAYRWDQARTHAES